MVITVSNRALPDSYSNLHHLVSLSLVPSGPVLLSLTKTMPATPSQANVTCTRERPMAAQTLHVPTVTNRDCEADHQADHRHEEQGRPVINTSLYPAMVHARVDGMDDDGGMMKRGDGWIKDGDSSPSLQPSSWLLREAWNSGWTMEGHACCKRKTSKGRRLGRGGHG